MNKEFLRMQKLAGVITESQYNKKKSLIENENKKFTDVLGTGGYHLNITDKMKQDIKTQLGIGDEDIKFGYEEEQGDRFYWFATIGINLEALPADKKSSYKDIISKIVRPAKTDDKTSTPTNSPKTAKSGLLNKIKSAFSENQLNEDEVDLKLTELKNQKVADLKKEMEEKKLTVLYKLGNKEFKPKPTSTGSGWDAKTTNTVHNAYLTWNGEPNGTILVGIGKDTNKAQEILPFVEKTFKDEYDIQKGGTASYWEIRIVPKQK